MSEDKDLIVASLLEANEILGEQLNRMKVSQSTLRAVNSALRKSIMVMQSQLDIAHQNDEMFKKFCAGEFDAPNQFVAEVAEGVEGGLPKTATVVEPLI